jgi:DNA-binding MarR family transcriptional regulator
MCHTEPMARKRATSRSPLALPGSPRARRTAPSKPIAKAAAPGTDGGAAGLAPSPSEAHRQDVAVYVAAGGDESVQRVITAVHGLARRLNQWYDRQLADLDISAGEWAVMSTLVRDESGKGCTPSELADAANVAPSSMTHRLDRMTARGLVTRATDPENRVRVRVALSDRGWELFRNAIRESDMLESDVLATLTPGQRAKLAELLEVAITGLDSLEN